LEATHEPDIRARLHPHAIFDEVGKSSRDYYFNIPAGNVVEDWDPQIMQAFSGIYLCAKANDRNSYLPLPTLRRWFEDPKAMPEFEKKSRSVNIAQYVGERSILILQAKKEAGYFYAAEFPLSAIYPDSVQAMDVRMVYEGIGIASANSIHIQLRECLARVPKTHSILIGQKSSYHSANKQGFSMYLHPGMEIVKAEWDHLSEGEQAAMHAEYESTMQAEHYLTGPAQISVSPLNARKNRVGMTFSEEMVYHRKPQDFLRNRNIHFLLPILDNTKEIEKLLANPLAISDIL